LAALAEQRRYLDLDLEGELGRLEQLRHQHVAELEALDGSGWERGPVAMENTAS